MGKNTKRKKSFYLAPSKRHRLDTIPGTIGFLGTCNTHEDVCVKEGYSLLNLYADQLYGPEQTKDEKQMDKPDQPAPGAVVASPAMLDDSSDEEDVDAALKKEVSSLQGTSSQSEGRPPRRFQAIRCGTANNVFFHTLLADPLPTLMAAMDDIMSSGQQRTKHLIRLLPVHAVCKAYLDKIEKAFSTFCIDRFKGHTKTFYAVVKVMSNSSIKKEEVVSLVLKVMDQIAPECRPVLTKDADVAIVVSVLVTNCYIGEAPLYLDKYKKYNLIELASPAALPNVESQSNGVRDGEATDGGGDCTVAASADGEANGKVDSIATETPDKSETTKDTDVIPSCIVKKASDHKSSGDKNVGITPSNEPIDEKLTTTASDEHTT